MQTYLKSQKISLIKKRVLFKARTRIINVPNNFGKKSQCPLCMTVSPLNDNDQSHLIDCIIIKLACPEILENKSNCSYEDIFSNDLVIRTREKVLKEGAKNTLRGGAHNAAAFGRKGVLPPFFSSPKYTPPKKKIFQVHLHSPHFS